MSSKYSALPDIDNQPDVYETPDFVEEPEVSDDGYVINDETSEDVVKQKISVQDGINTFKKSGADGSNADFMEKITRQKKQMYRVYVRKPNLDTSEYEIAPTDPELQETPLMRLRRLMYEVQELSEEVEKNKESEAPVQVSHVDLVSQISSLQTDLNRISQSLNEAPLDDKDGSVIKQAELGKRLIHQLESFKNMGAPQVNGTDKEDVQKAPAKEAGKNMVTYELYYSPESTKIHSLAKAHELDERITALEKIIGTAYGQNFEELSISVTNSNLIAAVENLEQHMQLLTQSRNLDTVARKAKTLTSELEKVHELKNKDLANGGFISYETEEKINHLFGLLDKIDPLLPVAPALVNRLKSLQQLHSEAALFGETIKMLASEQSKITEELKSLGDVGEKLEQSFNENNTVLQGNVESVDARVTNLMARLEKLQSKK